MTTRSIPLLGYGAGIAKVAGVISLELATDVEEYERGPGFWISTALSPAHAIALERELIASGERAAAGGTIN